MLKLEEEVLVAKQMITLHTKYGRLFKNRSINVRGKGFLAETGSVDYMSLDFITQNRWK